MYNVNRKKDFMAVRLPKKIEKCPIIEAVVEIRFSSDLPSDAVFGVIYKAFQSDFPTKPLSLPILQIPETIRSQDPNLIFKPHHQLVKDNIVFQIGPRVMSLANKLDYMGWTKFSKVIKSYFERIISLGIITNIERFGLRYINFFSTNDIFDKIKLKVTNNEKPFINKNLFLKSVIESGGFTNTLQISDNASCKKNDKTEEGSVIDIDTYCDSPKAKKSEDLFDLVEKAHFEEKSLFFELLTEKFIASLTPIYE